MNIKIPHKLLEIFTTDKRYIVIYGGRGSAKSTSVAYFLLAKALEEKRRILCTREIQNSIKDSVYKLLCDLIQGDLEKFFTIYKDSIVAYNGSEFIFKGLRHNIQSIKSTEGVDLCWVEEAQSISMQSLDILTPTIRKKDSKIIFTYNPLTQKDAVYKRFLEDDRDDVCAIKIIYEENPFLPDVLRHEAEYDRHNDYALYRHKWLGEFYEQSDVYVLADKVEVDEFYYGDDAIIRYGADWGFAVDPTVLVKCVVFDGNLYIEKEAYKVKCDIDHTPVLFDTIPEARKGLIVADSARPETINYMRRAGFTIRGSKKGSGSVKEGISFLRSFKKIYIHPECKNTINEFLNYRYKTDRITGEVLQDIEKGNDHTIDAVRYAVEDLMRLGIHKNYSPMPNKLKKTRRSEVKNLPV